MNKGQKIIKLTMTLILVASLLAPAVLWTRPAPACLHPLLAELAAETPEQMVRVIVQESENSNLAERLVSKLGGRVTKDLPLINGFAAELPAKSVTSVETLNSVNWVSLDAPMVPAEATSYTVRDEFNAVSYNGSDGTVSWESDWVEYDVYGTGPTAGNVDIFNGALRLDDYPDSGTSPSATREVNLSPGVSNAVLSFDFQTGIGVDAYRDKIAVEVSADGGKSYKLLEVINDLRGGVSGSRKYDITPYISADTMVRFRVYANYGGRSEYFLVDNVQVGIFLRKNLFRETLGIDQLHAEGISGQGVTVAVIDSGIGKHPDLAERLIVAPDYGIGDLYGHGTHVAGIIGGDGSASGGVYTGIAPGVHFISLGVSDEFGMAYESDVVEALQWVHENKDTYNIRVINLSLNSTVEDSYHNSGIDAAVEILWLNGVVIVASAGNKGPAGGYNTAKTAPANDPFIIVVGASDEHETYDRANDTITPFSSFGVTTDGFFRPDIIAPGYNIYSALSPDSTWDDAYPDRLGFGGEYIRLSGTSMAAPMVTGAVALLLQDEPNLTPDQVKYRLTHTGSTLTDGEGNTFPYLDVYAVVHGTTTESAYTGFMPHILLVKMAMIAYWASENGGENIDWENVNWESVNWNAVNWNAVNWNAVNWNAVNWNAVNWNAVNWNAVNWNAVNWNAVNWNAVNWNAVNWNAVNWNAAKLDGIFWGRGKKD
jgi:serine protease AprX